jgi:hypothetical protein
VPCELFYYSSPDLSIPIAKQIIARTGDLKPALGISAAFDVSFLFKERTGRGSMLVITHFINKARLG